MDEIVEDTGAYFRLKCVAKQSNMYTGSGYLVIRDVTSAHVMAKRNTALYNDKKEEKENDAK